MPALTSLDLSYNKIGSMDLLCSLSKLRFLRMSDNRIPEIPPEVSLMKELLELEVSHNIIEEVCAEVYALVKLSVFNINANRLKVLWPPKLKQLHQSVELRVHNPLSQNAASKTLRSGSALERVSNIKKSLVRTSQDDLSIEEVHFTRMSLSTVSAYGNLLQDIPEQFFEDLSATLTNLNLSQNKLRRIPDGVFKASSLIKLNLAQNLLNSFPPSFSFLRLQELSIAGNLFESIESLKIMTLQATNSS